MLELKKEYFLLQQERNLYPIKLDLSKSDVYGCKEREAFVYKIPNERYKSNAGYIDFSLYPNGVWNDYTAIKIIEKLPYFEPSISFNKLSDITANNLNKLKDEIKQHIVDLEVAVTESYIFIDSGVPEQNNLPYLPNGCVWFRNGVTGNIEALPVDEVADRFSNLTAELYKEIKKLLDKDYEKTILLLNEFLESSFNNVSEKEKEIIEKIKKHKDETINSIKEEAVEEKKDIEKTGENIKEELKLILEQYDIKEFEKLLSDNYKGVYNPNTTYYPGEIYYKQKTDVILFDIPNSSVTTLVKEVKTEENKKFYRLYNGKEKEFNFIDNSDHKVIGFEIKSENKFTRNNNTIFFEFPIINYVFGFSIPTTENPNLIKESVLELDNENTELLKGQSTVPLHILQSQKESILKKFNY